MDYVVNPDGSIEMLSSYISEHKVRSSMPVERRSKSVKNQTSRSANMVKCPYCISYVRKDRLEKHCTRIHGETVADSYQAIKKLDTHSQMSGNVPTSKNNDERMSTNSRTIASAGMSRLTSRKKETHPRHPSADTSTSQLATNRNVAVSHESEFGMKGLGFMAREDSGRFGSIPLFDDYGSGEDQ